MASVHCASCNGVPRDCVDSDCCAQIYCWSCVVNGVNCSFCGNPVDPAKVKENLAVRRIVANMPKNCTYEGCGVVLPGDKMKEHEQVCDFKPLVCPNSDLCGILLSRELKDHLINDCEYRTVDCAFKCGTVLKAKDFQDHISKDCPEVTVHCGNMCNAQMKRGNLAFHMQNECPFQPIPCEFAEYGCTKSILRVQYGDHMEAEMKSHFVLLSKAVKNQSNEIKELKQAVNNLSNNGRPLIDAALVHGGIQHARQFGSSAAHCIGEHLEALRVKGCEMYANRVAIAAQTRHLIETSRIAQFVLFLVLHFFLSHISRWLLFTMFLISTGLTLGGMFLGGESFRKKFVQIFAWACIFAIIFHAPAVHHRMHHHTRFFR